MKKSKLKRSDIFWGLSIAFLVILQFWWLPGEKGSSADSYSNSINGKLGLYKTLSALFPHVERDVDSLIPANSHSVLLLVSPERYPTEVEERELLAYVRNGGYLLFAPAMENNACEIPSLGIEINSSTWFSPVVTTAAAPSTSSGSSKEQSQGNVPLEDSTANPTALPAEMPEGDVKQTDVNNAEDNAASIPPTSAAIDTRAGSEPASDISNPMKQIVDRSDRSETGLGPIGGDKDLTAEELGNQVVTKETSASSVITQGSVTWRSRSTLRLPTEYHAEPLVTSDDAVEVAFWNVGRGGVLVTSSPDIFSNRSMLFPESANLAVRLVEYLYKKQVAERSELCVVIVNEYLNASNAYQQTGVLFSPAMRIGTLQLVVLCLLSLWFGFHRFGPATAVSDYRRRSLTDAAESTGTLYSQLNDGGGVVRGYLEYIRSQLRRRFGGMVRLEDYDAIAQRSGLPVEQVRDQIRRAEQIASSGQVSPAVAATSLRWLATLHNKLSYQEKTRKK
ncbi:MAG: DUF4350 domain-containing protein [Planctomycetaceae bacterium]|nr:DUF4350 domain-containing protein [Planctomycetaceae bacterium]